MKKSPLLFSVAILFLVFFYLCFSGSIVRAADSFLKIQAIPDQNSVKSGMMFLLRVRVANSSSDSSADFWSNSCSYEKHWVTDNPAVLIQSWTCNENTLEEITLGPGDVYEKNIILYISKKDKTEPVTFRLGFKRMSEDGDVAEPLWSDPVTMNVIVPEEMKEAGAPMSPARSLGLEGRSSQAGAPMSPARSLGLEGRSSQAGAPMSPARSLGLEGRSSQAAPPADAKAPSQASEQASVTPGEANETPPAATVSSPAAPSENQPLAFQDPGVPIRIRPGEEFSILLVSNPSTGFRWKMTLPEDQQTVKLLGAGHVPPQKMMPGKPGQEVFKFKAMIPGETKADFVYERPWEPKTAPTRKIFTILVREN